MFSFLFLSLQMLKAEYLAEGLSESNAKKQAIHTFGKANDLKKKLSDSLCNYMSVFNILVGIAVFFTLFRIGAYIPVPAAGSEQERFTQIAFYTLLMNVIFCIPFGYFVPLFFKKAGKIPYVVLIPAILLILRKIYIYSLIPIPWNSISADQAAILLLFNTVHIALSVIGYLSGFSMLKLIHRSSIFCRSLV